MHKINSDKKGVEFTFTTVAVMLLAIIVLVFLIFLAVGGFKNLNNGSDCKLHGATCEDGPLCPTGKYPGAWKCDGSKICCTNSPFGN